jgi:hypothetical protein
MTRYPAKKEKTIIIRALRAVAPMMECVQDHLKLLAMAAELERQL